MPEKRTRVSEIEQELAKPNVWDQQEHAAALSKELSDAKETVETFNRLSKELQETEELFRISQGDENALAEIEAKVHSLAEEFQKQEFRTFLSGKYDAGNAIIAITAGAGGQDAQDWAAMLFRMYQRYCERQGWKLRILHEAFGDAGPEGRISIKQVAFEAEGTYAYGFLRTEQGVHRLVRISPFSAQSLRHTSFASVEVLPKVDLSQEQDIEIRPDDVKVETLKASGPGGQNVNKRETAVRITHIPTGIIVASQVDRNQQQNRTKALELLAGKLYQKRERERQEELAKLRGVQVSIEWGSQIRSYVLHPYQLVKDHRTGVEMSNVESVLDGEIHEFIEAGIKL